MPQEPTLTADLEVAGNTIKIARVNINTMRCKMFVTTIYTIIYNERYFRLPKLDRKEIRAKTSRDSSRRIE